MDCDYEDQDLYIGIRPEGFIVDPKGPLSTHLERIEVMGRDKSIVSTTPFVLGNQDAKKDETPIVRSIIDTDTVVSPDKNGNVHFSIKPNKIFLFNRYTELRVNVEEGGIVPKAVTKEQYEAKLAEEAAAKAATLEEKENHKVGSKFKNIFKKKNKKTEEE
jgi:hypothetical protein